MGRGEVVGLYYREQKHICGKDYDTAPYMEVDLYPVSAKKHKASRRAKKKEASSLAQQTYNDNRAKRYHVQLVNANFGKGDFSWTGTYDDDHLPEPGGGRGLAGGRDGTVAMDTGRTYEARYVAGDERNDLAVLKVELTGLPAATFGDSDQLVVGDKVYAIGNPLGVELRGTLTDGIVSAINRDVQVDGRTMTLVQTNAALNSGNSGGPLINACGQVVGINTIKMSSDYSNVEGLGFAIPSASIRRLVNDLLTYGEVRPEPSFGVTVLQTGTRLEDDIWGLQVLEVTPGSAADLAGIREGDFVLAAGGRPVETSQELLRIRRQLYVGDQVTMEIWRDGERMEVTLTLNDPVE